MSRSGDVDRIEKWNRDNEGAAPAHDATRFTDELPVVVDVLQDIDEQDMIIRLIVKWQRLLKVMHDVWQGALVQVESRNAKRTEKQPLVGRAAVASQVEHLARESEPPQGLILGGTKVGDDRSHGTARRRVSRESCLPIG